MLKKEQIYHYLDKNIINLFNSILWGTFYSIDQNYYDADLMESLIVALNKRFGDDVDFSKKHFKAYLSDIADVLTEFCYNEIMFDEFYNEVEKILPYYSSSSDIYIDAEYPNEIDSYYIYYPEEFKDEYVDFIKEFGKSIRRIVDKIDSSIYIDDDTIKYVIDAYILNDEFWLEDRFPDFIEFVDFIKKKQ